MKTLRRFLPFLLLSSLCALYVACSKEETPDAIGSNITNPMDVVTSPEGTHFIVLNANVNTDSNGSLLVLRDDKKVYTKEIPRLGKRLQFMGNALFVTADGESNSDIAGQVLLYEWKNQNGAIRIDYVKRWTYDINTCTPYNVVTSPDPAYPIVAVSCTNGALLVGKTAPSLADTTLHLIRRYPGYTRNAMYIDTKRKLLFAFVTSFGDAILSDTRYTDAKTWTGSTQVTSPGGNDVPDLLEQSIRTTRNLQTYGSPYQFVVLDLAQAEADGFAYKDKDKAPDLIASELRWMYFNLNNAGTPDVTLEADEKYYRTNFAEARPGFDADSFYLSHSGRGEVDASEHANNLIEVRFTGDPKAKLINGIYQVPLTKTYFDFTRKFGFKGPQTTPSSYMQGFSLATLRGEKVAIINDSFRDVVLFKDPYYSISVASIENPTSFVRRSSEHFTESFYRTAFSPVSNRLLALSYHSSSAFLYDVQLEFPLTIVAEIP